MLVAQLRTWIVQGARALEVVSERPLCHSRKDSLPIGKAIGKAIEDVEGTAALMLGVPFSLV